MGLDREISNLLAKGMADELNKNASSIDEIMRVTKRIPFNESDIRIVRSALEMWIKDGFDVAIGPIKLHTEPNKQNDIMSCIKNMAYDGMISISAGPPFMVELLVIKSDEGKGLFGGQKIGYQCFMTIGLSLYTSVGRASKLILAVTKLSNVLRSGSV